MKKLEKRVHERFMRLALAQAEEALAAAEFPVGCVIVEDGIVVAGGGRVNSGIDFCELDHAEINALRLLQKTRPEIDLGKVTIYSTMEPCLMCYATLIVNGVRKVVYGYEDVMGGGTNLPLGQLSPLYAALEMEVVPHVLREESLLLFQRFFRSEGNGYLQDSLLAEYTLRQQPQAAQESDETLSV